MIASRELALKLNSKRGIEQEHKAEKHISRLRMGEQDGEKREPDICPAGLGSAREMENKIEISKEKIDQTKLFHHSYRSIRSSVIRLTKQLWIKTLQAAVGRCRNRSRRAKRRIEVWFKG